VDYAIIHCFGRSFFRKGRSIHWEPSKSDPEPEVEIDQDKDSAKRPGRQTQGNLLHFKQQFNLRGPNMKTNKMLVAAMLVSAAGLTTFSVTASAGTNADASGKTRAQVRAELIQARADGFQPSSEAPEIYYKEPVQSGKTRAQVKTELIQARADGFQPSSEAPEIFYKEPVQSGKTRAQVRAELMQSIVEDAALKHHPSPEE
jgi:hypothetical protein